MKCVIPKFHNGWELGCTCDFVNKYTCIYYEYLNDHIAQIEKEIANLYFKYCVYSISFETVKFLRITQPTRIFVLFIQIMNQICFFIQFCIVFFFFILYSLICFWFCTITKFFFCFSKTWIIHVLDRVFPQYFGSLKNYHKSIIWSVWFS